MTDVFCIAEDRVVMPLNTRSENAVLALAEFHPEVVVFFADWDEVYPSEFKEADD